MNDAVVLWGDDQTPIGRPGDAPDCFPRNTARLLPFQYLSGARLKVPDLNGAVPTPGNDTLAIGRPGDRERWIADVAIRHLEGHQRGALLVLPDTYCPI